jgi:hypothetical protein
MSSNMPPPTTTTPASPTPAVPLKIVAEIVFSVVGSLVLALTAFGVLPGRVRFHQALKDCIAEKWT